MIHPDYELSSIDEGLAAEIEENVNVIFSIIGQYKDAHTDPTQPRSPNKLMNEGFALNARLLALINATRRIYHYYGQWKTAKDKRYNDLYVQFKRDTTVKRTADEIKALAESQVYDEHYYYHLDGLTAWKKRMDMIIDRADEQINLYKKALGEVNKTFGI